MHILRRLDKTAILHRTAGNFIRMLNMVNIKVRPNRCRQDSRVRHIEEATVVCVEVILVKYQIVDFPALVRQAMAFRLQEAEAVTSKIYNGLQVEVPVAGVRQIRVTIPVHIRLRSRRVPQCHNHPHPKKSQHHLRLRKTIHSGHRKIYKSKIKLRVTLRWKMPVLQKQSKCHHLNANLLKAQKRAPNSVLLLKPNLHLPQPPNLYQTLPKR